MTYVSMSVDGKISTFNPSDYCWMPRAGDLGDAWTSGLYDPQFESKVNDDGRYELTITQTMMPLVRVR